MVNLHEFGVALASQGFEVWNSTSYLVGDEGQEPRFRDVPCLGMRKGQFTTSYNGQEEHPDVAHICWGLLETFGPVFFEGWNGRYEVNLCINRSADNSPLRQLDRSFAIGPTKSEALANAVVRAFYPERLSLESLAVICGQNNQARSTQPVQEGGAAERIRTRIATLMAAAAETSKSPFDEGRTMGLESALMIVGAEMEAAEGGAWKPDLPGEEGWWWKFDPMLGKPCLVRIIKRGRSLYDGSWSPAIHTLQQMYGTAHGMHVLWYHPGPIPAPPTPAVEKDPEVTR